MKTRRFISLALAAALLALLSVSPGTAKYVTKDASATLTVVWTEQLDGAQTYTPTASNAGWYAFTIWGACGGLGGNTATRSQYGKGGCVKGAAKLAAGTAYTLVAGSIGGAQTAGAPGGGLGYLSATVNVRGGGGGGYSGIFTAATVTNMSTQAIAVAGGGGGGATQYTGSTPAINGQVGHGGNGAERYAPGTQPGGNAWAWSEASPEGCPHNGVGGGNTGGGAMSLYVNGSTSTGGANQWPVNSYTSLRGMCASGNETTGKGGDAHQGSNDADVTNAPCSGGGGGGFMGGGAGGCIGYYRLNSGNAQAVSVYNYYSANLSLESTAIAGGGGGGASHITTTVTDTLGYDDLPPSVQAWCDTITVSGQYAGKISLLYIGPDDPSTTPYIANW